MSWIKKRNGKIIKSKNDLVKDDIDISYYAIMADKAVAHIEEFGNFAATEEGIERFNYILDIYKLLAVYTNVWGDADGNIAPTLKKLGDYVNPNDYELTDGFGPTETFAFITDINNIIKQYEAL